MARLFDVDIEGVRGPLEDLFEALDVVGFSKPLERWEDEDSKARMWFAQLEEREADEVVSSVKQQLQAVSQDIVKWAGNDKRSAQEGLKLVQMSLRELEEHCTIEEPD